MNRQRVASDLESREPVFTVPQFQSQNSGVQVPAAFIWSGLSQGGVDRYFPVIFDRTDSEITLEFIRQFSQFSSSDPDDRSLHPIVYQNNTSPVNGFSVEIDHQAKIVAESEVDTSLEGMHPVRNAARHWQNEVSERTLNYDKSWREYGWLYRLQFMVFGTDFQALFPVFLGKPNQSTLRTGLDEAKIPCVTIAPDNVEESGDYEPVETWVKPTIFNPR